MNSKTFEKQVGDIYYHMEKRTICEESREGVCYDLIMESEKERLCFPDIAGTSLQAEKVFKLFTDMQVQFFEAPYIVEDLLSDHRYLFLKEEKTKMEKEYTGSLF